MKEFIVENLGYFVGICSTLHSKAEMIKTMHQNPKTQAVTKIGGSEKNGR